jgi:hypothetical protein
MTRVKFLLLMYAFHISFHGMHQLALLTSGKDVPVIAVQL